VETARTRDNSTPDQHHPPWPLHPGPLACPSAAISTDRRPAATTISTTSTGTPLGQKQVGRKSEVTPSPTPLIQANDRAGRANGRARTTGPVTTTLSCVKARGTHHPTTTSTSHVNPPPHPSPHPSRICMREGRVTTTPTPTGHISPPSPMHALTTPPPSRTLSERAGRWGNQTEGRQMGWVSTPRCVAIPHYRGGK
jgi:hypothetical protein